MRIAERRSALALVLLLAAPAGTAAAEVINDIILRVNDEIATRFEYEDRKNTRLGLIAEAKGLEPEEKRKFIQEAPRATMRELLDELLLLSRARQLIIEPSRGEIDDSVDSMRNRLGLPDEQAMLQALAASGMTMEDYRERTTRQLKVSQVVQREVNPQIRVEDEWLQRYYRENAAEFRIPPRVRLREIVLPSEQVAGEAARALAAEIRAALAAGEDMNAAVDRLRGDRPERIVGPVEHGWVEPGELAGALDTEIWKLPPGALSEPVDARGGLHLLEVQERVEEAMRPYGEVKEEIAAREKERRREEFLRKYLGDLEKKAYLIENIPPEAAGFRDVEAEAAAPDPLAAFAPQRTPSTAPPPAPRIEVPKPEPTPPAPATPPL